MTLDHPTIVAIGSDAPAKANPTRIDAPAATMAPTIDAMTIERVSRPRSHRA